MSFATRALRREVEQSEHPIGLGWLLAISLCGGVLLFTTVGLLLVWWVKKNRHPGPQMVYGYSAATRNSLLPPSSSRLIKRRLLGSESFSKVSSRLSSRFSFSAKAQQHAVQTPLPTHEGVQLPERRRTVSRGRKRSRSWVDEDDLHGPKMMVRSNKRSARESWFGRDGCLGMAPTLPNVGMIVPESEKGYVQVGELPAAQGPQSRWLPRSQTEPRLATIPGSPLSPGDDSSSTEAAAIPLRGMSVPVFQPTPIRPAQMRHSKTDPSLKGILRSTDLRLSQRSSRSSVKASISSSLKASPTKPSGSSQTGTSGRSGSGWRASSSPPKRGGSFAGSRNNSTSTIGSAANSLILAATQELELPGGSSSPSKARSVHWERQDQQMANRSPERAQYASSLTQSPQRQSPQRQSPQRQSPQRQSPQRQSPQRHSPQRHSPQKQNPQVMMMVPHVQMQPPHMKFPQMQHPQLVFPQMQHSSISHVQQHRSSKKTAERRMSVESDKSSSLSTLYSTNDPEEEMPRQQQQTQDDDPFVEKGGPRRWPSWQARQRPATMDSSQRRAKALSAASLTMGEPPYPPPLRPVSEISQPKMGCEALTSPRILQPQARPANRCSISQMPYLLEAPSEASFASVSVESDATEVLASEMQRLDWVDSSDSASSSPTTPTRQTRYRDMSSSSPYDEREIMSLLMGTAPANRTLPLSPSPSVIAPDGSIVTVLSPPPRGGGGGSGGGGLVRQASTSSSIYTLESFIGTDLGVALTASPSPRATMRSLVEGGQRLSNTVAELRRMNSMISTYSVASLASTAVGEGDNAPSTLPASLSGSGAGLTASRSIRFGTASIGSRHYLNIGGDARRSMVVTGSHRYRPRRGQHRRAETYYYGKENLGLGLRLSCIMDGTINVVTQDVVAQEDEDEDEEVVRDGDGLECGPAMEIIEGIPSGVLSQKLTPVEQLIAAEQRQNLRRASLDSLGLYDNDGFLLSSPERDAKRTGVRV
ncbi:hypothetical protein ACSS6W_009137 [Trichoderma asperelloides]